MATFQSPLVVGVFEREVDARKAIQELHRIGFTKDQIGMAVREGGTITTNLYSDLVNLRVPEAHARYYDDEFRAGRVVVSVRSDGREQDAMNILLNHGAYAYGTRRPSGQTVAQERSESIQASRQTSASGTVAQSGTSEKRSIPLREEELQAYKERVKAGEAVVYKDVVTEQQTINVPVTHEEVIVEHRTIPGGRPSDTPIGQDEVIRVPVTEEQVHVTKTPITTGEVTVSKQAVQEEKQITETVRREEAHVEREGRAIIQETDTDTDTKPRKK